MSVKSEICQRKEIMLSQQKVGKSPRIEKYPCEGWVMGKKEKYLVLAGANLGQSVECCNGDTSGETQGTYNINE